MRSLWTVLILMAFAYIAGITEARYHWIVAWALRRWAWLVGQVKRLVKR